MAISENSVSSHLAQTWNYTNDIYYKYIVGWINMFFHTEEQEEKLGTLRMLEWRISSNEEEEAPNRESFTR